VYKVLENRQISESTFELTVEAPRIARKVKAGQFLIVRVSEDGERVPFTFSDWSVEEGWIKFIFLRIGKTTHMLSHLSKGDYIMDLAAPLGKPTEIEDMGRCVVVGGGVGLAVAYTAARAMCDAGKEVTVIAGARNADLLILQDEFRKLPLKQLIVTTDDGSAGFKGLVTQPLKEMCEQGLVDNVFIVGPAIMMKFCAQTSGQYGVPTIASLNPIMVDGTGMCGACRVSVESGTKFACVDGPDFDAAQVDWEELMSRQRTYIDQERLSDAEYSSTCSCQRNGHAH